MIGRLGVSHYLALPEQLSPHELVWGIVREPPAPCFGHQASVGRVFVALDAHVRAQTLGVVCVSPLDVVLDPDRGLVVQPDVFFVSNDRAGIIRERIWGAPDLVVEVASRRTLIRDRTTKLDWYRRYGVRECWIVRPASPHGVGGESRRHRATAFGFFKGDERIKSVVLPELDLTADSCFP